MLVLSRKQGEELLIGNVSLRVASISGGRVTLLIDAPENVRILRGELVGRKLQNSAADSGRKQKDSLPCKDKLNRTHGANASERDSEHHENRQVTRTRA